MKILRIHLKNLNSLRGVHEIDLEDPRIAQAGLFAITGPTGAGKSTLLDAITLALYGRAARYGKQVHPEDMMSRHESECHAEVDFEVTQGRFRAVWQLRRARGKADGALQNAKRYLHDADGEVIASKIQDVAERIEDLCGLDYDRFTRSVLLAQGEFAKFLRATDDERAALLESLTRTTIYSDLGRLVHEQVQERERSLDSAEQSLTLLPVLPLEDATRLHASAAADEAASRRLREALEARREALATARRRQELESTRQRLETERTAWRVEWEGAAADLERLRLHRQTIPHVAALTRWQEALRLETSSTQSLAEAARATEQAHLVWQRHRSTAPGTVPPAAGDAPLAEDLGILEGMFAVHAEALARLAAQPAPEPLPDAAAVRTEREALLLHGGEAAEQERLQVALRREQELAAQRLTLEERLRVASRQDEAIRLLVDLARRLEDATDSVAASRNEARLAAALEDSRNQTLEARRRIASLESHRSRLTEGEPCPLCGALEHPWATDPVPDDLAAAEAACQEASRTRAAAETRLHNAERAAATLDARAEDVTRAIDDAAAELAALDLRAPAISLDQVGTATAEARAEATACRTRLARLRELQQADAWFQAREQAEAAASRLQDRLSHHGIPRTESFDAPSLRRLIQQRVEAFRTYDARRREAESLRLARETARADRETRESDLTAELTLHGFASIVALRAAVLPQAEETRWSAVETRLRDTGNALEARWQDCLEALAVLKAADASPPEDAETLAQAVQTTEASLTETQARLTLARQRLATDAENRQLHASRSAALAADRAQLLVWRKLRHLIGDAVGKKFRTFAQGISLDLMVRHANRHLARLTARYQLRRSPGTELGLEIEDAYQAGTRRPTASLSGGESFLASLALALALSDLAGRNVRIDSLFIDEGFGSLDADALETALCALESLRQQDKLVGIISHVGLLQERIGAQISLEKRPDGTSTLEICTA